MPNYFSKSSIENFPNLIQQIDQQNIGYLKSLLFKDSIYLNELAKNDLRTPKIRINSKGDDIRLIRLALSVISKIYNLNLFNQNSISSTNVYDTDLETAISIFANSFDYQNRIPNYIDGKLIVMIDELLTNDLEFNESKTKYLGKRSKKTFDFIDEIEVIDGKTYYVYYFNDENITQQNKIKLSKKLKGNPIVPLESNRIKIHIKAIPDPSNGFNGFSGTKSFNSNIKISLSNEEVTLGEFNTKLDNTSTREISDNNTQLHTIKPGESLNSIVESYYYGNGSLRVKNPYKDEGDIDYSDVFEFPERHPLPTNLREFDARYQFYMNLIYYSNLTEENGNVYEWGIKQTQNQTRYSENHLDQVEIYDNELNSSTPESSLPNYYRFLKRMESIQSSNKINFNLNPADQENYGKTTSFETEVGKCIKIPSRQYADSLYNFLNYRPSDFLTTVTNSDGSTEQDDVEDSIFDVFIDAASDLLTNTLSLATEIKDDIITTYQECRDFMSAAYDFISDVAASWPRGVGCAFEHGASITWGIPIKTKLELSKSLYRKVSKKEELIFVYSRDFIFGVGAQEVFGENISFGRKSGHGSNKKSFDFSYGASFESMFDLKLTNEYEFPVRKGETALLSMLIAIFGGEKIESATKIIDFLFDCNLDPKNYLTKFEASLQNKTSAGIAAQAGLVVPNQNNMAGRPKIPLDNKDNISSQNDKKSYGNVYNIWDKIPGFGVSANAQFDYGVSFSYNVDYGKNPFTAKQKSRVFEKINLDMKFYVHILLQADIDLITNLFKKIFAQLSSPVVFNLENLSFDRGFFLGVNYEIKRKVNPNQIQSNDFNYGQVNFTGISNNVISFNTNNVDKKCWIYFGTYSGDVDTLCNAGSSEVKLNLDMLNLKELLFNSNYSWTYNNIKNLFVNLEIHKKVGYSYEKNQNQKFQKQVSNAEKIKGNRKHRDNGIISGVLNKFKQGDSSNKEISYTNFILNFASANINSKNMFLECGIALDVKMSIEFDLISNLIEYYLKKAYLKDVLSGSQNNDLDRRLINQEKRIEKLYFQYGISTSSSEFYNNLYSSTFITIPGHSQSNVKGLLGVLGEVSSIFAQDLDLSNDEVLSKALKSVYHFNRYISIGRFEKESIFNIHSMLKYFSFIASVSNLEMGLEAKLNVGFEWLINAGGDGLTIGISIDGSAEVNYRNKLMENGEFTIEELPENDPLKAVFMKIKQDVAPGIVGKNKVKTLFVR